jgi:hypothetical protein
MSADTRVREQARPDAAASGRSYEGKDMNEPQRRAGVLDDHDRTRHLFTIIVNGRQKQVLDHVLTFDQVVKLAFDDLPPGENVIFTVTYSRAAGPKLAGTLVEGQTVKIKDGTVFNVTATDKS